MRKPPPSSGPAGAGFGAPARVIVFALAWVLVFVVDGCGGGEPLTEAGPRLADDVHGDGPSTEALVASPRTSLTPPRRVAVLLSLSARAPGAANADDELLVLIVAHGGPLLDRDGRWEAAVRLAGADGRGETVSVAQIGRTLASLGVGHRALVLDSCLPPDTSSGPPPTLLLLSTAPRELAAADVGKGGVYTRCFADAVAGGAPSLFAAHAAASACVRIDAPDQEPQVQPALGPPADLALGARRAQSPPLLLLGGDVRGRTTVDGAPPDARGGVAVLTAGRRSISVSDGAGALVSGVARTVGDGDVLSVVDGAASGPSLWASDTRPIPRFTDVGVSSGFVSLTSGLLEAVVAVDLGGNAGAPGLFVTRREAPPLCLANVAPPGSSPRYVDATASLGPPGLPTAGSAGGAAAVYDWRDDGRPSVCWIAVGLRLDALGHELGRRTEAQGCDWLQRLEGPSPTLFAGCTDPGPPSRERPMLFPGPGLEARPAPDDAPDFPRRVLTVGSVRYAASANTRVRAYDATTWARRPTLDLPAPEGAHARSELVFTHTGRILVLDSDAGRVEVWRPAEPPVREQPLREGLVGVGPGAGHPSWDELRERWYIPTPRGIVVFDARRSALGAPIPIEGPVSGLGLADGALWVSELTDPPQLRRIDLASGATTWRRVLLEAAVGPIVAFPHLSP